ncbi:hypothetical protein V8G54_017946 [Vigna mungo]|uniref:Uncharacterized protein n=1 Tax=Vigna mungo TaxID=3915 RepID=A0AAQ3N934_VIGMU
MMSVRILEACKQTHPSSWHYLTLPNQYSLHRTNNKHKKKKKIIVFIYLKTHYHHQQQQQHHHHHLHHYIYHFSSKIVLTICSLIMNNIISNLRIFIYICELTEGKRKTLIKHKKCFENVVIILRKKKGGRQN